MTDRTADGTADIETLTNPESLFDSSVPCEEVHRELPPENFEAARSHYDNIDGVVQIGITDPDGRVLLMGSPEDGEWAPPGGPVEPGADWVGAARMTMENQTGTEVTIEETVLLEELIFHEEGSEERFSSHGVSFRASVEDETFIEEPTLVEHPHLPEDTDETFEWFDSVPEDAHENHIEHIELFL